MPGELYILYATRIDDGWIITIGVEGWDHTATRCTDENLIFNGDELITPSMVKLIKKNRVKIITGGYSEDQQVKMIEWIARRLLDSRK